MRALAIIAVLAGCNAPDRGPRWKAAGATSPRGGGTLRFAVADSIRTLDPAVAYDEISFYALQPLLATLVGFGRDELVLRPDLAERWELADGGTTYRFWLRPGITYSTGEPIVAADFKFALEYVLQSADSPYGSFLGDVVGVEEVLAGKQRDCAGIIAVSDRELVIQLVRPSPAFLYVLALKFASPLRPDHVAAAGTQLRRRPLASGPYELVSWDEGARLVMRKNPRYWDPARGHIAEIQMLENVPRDMQFLMFERGQLDVTARPAAPDYLWITSQPEWQPYLHRRAPMVVQGSRMNVNVKPFDDRRVRQALNYAVNKDHQIKLLNGTAVASHGLLPPGLFGRDDGLAPYPHDPAKARALLAEAGYPDGFRVEYTIAADPELEMLTLSIQSDLAAVGVHIDIATMSLNSYGSAIGKRGGPPFGFNGWIGDYPDPTTFLDAKFHSRSISDESSSNDSFYVNPELDALLDAARADLDPVSRAASYRRAERILHDDAPWIWGFHRLTIEATQPYVRDYEPHPVWLRDYTYAWLDLGPDGEPVPR
ncbi:MAG: ABC transporter substrate-binding protein [Deltaproteobacteria bacterium]|nr:ABC transporter substrate-binding protein [Deltaproteobacteria bacterium]